MAHIKNIGNGTGRLIGKVGSKATTIRIPNPAKVDVAKIDFKQTKQTYVSNQIEESVSKLLVLDKARQVEVLKAYLDELNDSGVLSKNKAYEFIAADRLKRTLPDGWATIVAGQSDSTIPDISVLDDKGVFQYYVEVKMPSAQAAPLVLKKGPDGKWITPEYADAETTQRVNILNREENLKAAPGSKVAVNEDEKDLMISSYQKELEEKGVKEIYVVTLEVETDKIFDVCNLKESADVEFALRTPRPKASGSGRLGYQKVAVAKEKAANIFGSSFDLEYDKDSGRTYIYVSEILGNKNDVKRNLGDGMFLGGATVVKAERVIDGVLSETFRYEVKRTSAPPSAEDGWTTLGQLSFK